MRTIEGARADLWRTAGNRFTKFLQLFQLQIGKRDRLADEEHGRRFRVVERGEIFAIAQIDRRHAAVVDGGKLGRFTLSSSPPWH